MSKVIVVVSLVDPSARPPVRVRVFSYTREGFDEARSHMEAERRSTGVRDVSLWEERVG